MRCRVLTLLQKNIIDMSLENLGDICFNAWPFFVEKMLKYDFKKFNKYSNIIRLSNSYKDRLNVNKLDFVITISILSNISP